MLNIPIFEVVILVSLRPLELHPWLRLAWPLAGPEQDQTLNSGQEPELEYQPPITHN